MTKSRIRPDIMIAACLAAVFVAIAAVMWAPGTIELLSRKGEINVMLRPYLHVMAVLALANAVFILALVPICRRTSGWIQRAFVWSGILVSTFIVTEVGTLMLIKKMFNIQHVGSRYTNSFEFSPSLGYAPKPNFRFPLASGELTHTAGGYRGPEAPADPKRERKTVLMIGGSSTYDLGLPDQQTWPTGVGRIFADQTRVLNLGIPGHSTAEHVTLASLVAWKYRPDVIVYYTGWNDIRSSHVNESTDYTAFHKKRMFHNFAVTEPTSFFATSYILKKIVSLLDETSLHRLTKVEIDSGTRETVDEKLLETYLHNVRMLAAITREMGATPVFVPQILNEHRLTSDQPYGWIPRVPQRAVPKVLAVFNEAMMTTARKAGAVVLPEVLDIDWQDSDFVDRGHFSEKGAKLFACSVAAGLVDRGVLAPPSLAAGPAAPDCHGALAEAERRPRSE